jgi:hypothetical protein
MSQIIINDIFPLQYETIEYKGGFNSDVVTIVSLANKIVIKRIGIKRGGFPVAEAHVIMQDILEYQRQLELLGVPMPKVIDAHLQYDFKSDKAVVYIMSDWAGDDVARILSLLNPNRDWEKIDSIVRAICQVLKHVCANRNGNALQVGIDTKANNFTIEYKKSNICEIFYVDQFPPHYHKNGQSIIEWISLKSQLGNELGEFKYFDWRGVLLTLTSQLARIKPPLKERFEVIVLEEFSRFIDQNTYDEFITEFPRLPWMDIRFYLKGRNIKAAERLIETCVNTPVFGIRYSVYTLREIALEFAQQRIISLDDLEDIFHNTHFEDEEFSLNRWEEVQSKLCRFLTSPFLNR